MFNRRRLSRAIDEHIYGDHDRLDDFLHPDCEECVYVEACDPEILCDKVKKFLRKQEELSRIMDEQMYDDWKKSENYKREKT